MDKPLPSLHVGSAYSAWMSALAVLFILFVVNITRAQAATWEIDPVRLGLSVTQKTTAMTIRNRGDQPSTVQLDGVMWQQQDGKDVYVPTRDLLISPPILTIAPRGSQIVRVALRRSADANEELSYRINLQELPSARTTEPSGIQVALRVSVPVFVKPIKVAARAHLVWTVVSQADKSLKVSATNIGNGHVQISDFELQDPKIARRITGEKVAIYLLPGQMHEWSLISNGITDLQGEQVRVKVFTDAGMQQSDVVMVRL